MSASRKVLGALRALLFRNSVERELDNEFTFHLEQETKKNIALGMNAKEARRVALMAFGSIDVAKEAHRDGRGSRWLEDFLIDARLALRSVRRNPG
ncbi:MAG: permease prefix domain 1-containing protein, partial [Gemmatimonadaceae bacterium]